MCFQFNLLCSSGYHRVSCLGTLSLDKFFLFYSMCSFIWQLLFPQFTEGQSLCKSVRVISFFSTLPTYMSYPDGVICLWTLFLTDKIIWPGKLAHFMYRKILTEPYFLYTVNKHVQMWKQKPGSVEEKNQKENLPNLLFSWSAFALIILTQRGMKLQNLGFFSHFIAALLVAKIHLSLSACTHICFHQIWVVRKSLQAKTVEHFGSRPKHNRVEREWERDATSGLKIWGRFSKFFFVSLYSLVKTGNEPVSVENPTGALTISAAVS